MDAAFTAEQDEIRRTLRTLLAGHGPGRAGRAPDGYDRALWRRLAAEAGLAGPALPAAYGGAGHGIPELAVAAEEAGRVLLPSPLLATSALAAPLIAALGTAHQREALLPRIAAGELVAAVALPGGSLSGALGLTDDNAGVPWAGGGRAGGIQAVRAAGGEGAEGGEGWRLYGEAAQVLDGHSADVLLAAAHTGGFPRSRTLLFLVRADTADGLVRTRQAALDATRPQARVELRHADATLLGDDDTADVTGALADTGRALAAVLAAEAAGAAAGVLERSVAHVGEREQAGVAAGSLGAVRDRLADLYVQVQAARAAAYCAARDTAGGGPALAQALEVLRSTASQAVQLSGPAGSGPEREARLAFERAVAGELLFGPVHRLREHAARRSGLFAQGAGGARPAAGRVAV